jgi:hypothetical protein
MKVIYVQNLQDIRNGIGTNGNTLMRGFLGLTCTVEGRGTFSLIHSIHNMGRPNVKAVLVYQEMPSSSCLLSIRHYYLEYHRNIT